MTDWVTEQIMKTERELGVLGARVTGMEKDNGTIRQDLKDGLDRIDRGVSVQIQHLRGDFQRLEDLMTKDRSELREILTHNQQTINKEVNDLIAQAQAETARQISEANAERAHDRLFIIVGAGLLAVGGTAALDVFTGLGAG